LGWIEFHRYFIDFSIFQLLSPFIFSRVQDIFTFCVSHSFGREEGAVMKTIELNLPLSEKDVDSLAVGDKVLLSGVIHTARDAAHKRWCETLRNGNGLPLELEGGAVYFAGPAPAKPGRPIGSVGPTTSYRMDDYSPLVIEKTGIRAMIGKGGRSPEVVEAMKKHKCVYLAAGGGLGALLADSVVSAEIVQYPDLGPEAVRRLEVRGFPAIVAIDVRGANLYESGPKQYERRRESRN
jgi:fumarate hydratase subunit beta